ncbi:diadenylate cyclase CdaA [Sporocytophaga myxococcoides]|uniref:diadenylate cyclase CdaA n=1 Tax=Sporocytophaga myxococcoides TaxID=153721 RepID=UPI0005EFF9B4|nr:diadenylate cyclase CdaA [Sporocytophaga myxococcoides]
MTLLYKIGFLEISWIDILDILLVSFLLYQLYKLLKGSIAVKIFLGFLSIYLIYLVVKAAKMELLTAILGQFIGVGVIAALILFQQEIRKFLIIIGKTTAFNRSFLKGLLWKKNSQPNADGLNLNPVIESAKILGGTNTGALIVFAKSSELKFYAESGDLMDALISKRLLIAIFQKNSPLHDGAVIIANNRIKAARCILPVSENTDLPAHLGLRHRAAIGLTEVTDSIVLIVSEETGQISLAINGKIHTNLSKSELKQKLHFYLFEDEEKIKEGEKEEIEN